MSMSSDGIIWGPVYTGCCGSDSGTAHRHGHSTNADTLLTAPEPLSSARDQAAIEVRALILASGGLGVCTADVLNLPTIAAALDALDEAAR